jgi:chemosensory pili system protein ChpA (sensor histidine kinase/response regulator)
MHIPILIVDSNPTAHLLLQMVLDRAGYRVLIARTGREAVQLIHKTKPALALVDYHLSGMDGAELCVRLNASTSTRYLPLILTSDDYEGHRAARWLPVQAYLRKPVSPKDMLKVIKQTLSPVRA